MQYETNASHTVDPYPSETTQDKVILSGTVFGSAKLVVKAGPVSYTSTGDGQWSVILPLSMGAYLIEISREPTLTAAPACRIRR